eukprot:Hpha_TRINITY_DN17051_c0_g1::TRINITY_DN17051_c0_g1_i1::g.166221::m.166221
MTAVTEAAQLAARVAMKRGAVRPPRVSWRSNTGAAALQNTAVQVGRERPWTPLPAVTTVAGQLWHTYEDLVDLHSRSSKIPVDQLAEMLLRSGLDLSNYAPQELDRHGPRALYIAVGADLPSVGLALLVQKWLSQFKSGVRLEPVMAASDPDACEVMPVVKALLRERQLPLTVVHPTEEDQELLAAGGATGKEAERALKWWLVYRTVRMNERHPLGTSILAGTTLDRNLQRIADRLCPDEEVPEEEPRPRLATELWDLSLGAKHLELPILDTARADWKHGQVTLHRPFLTVRAQQVRSSLLKDFGAERLAPLLTQPPPVHKRLSRHHSSQFLDVVRRSDVVVGARREAARDFVASKARLDYRLPWATFDPQSFRELDKDAAELALAALCGFVGGEPSCENWLTLPSRAIKEMAGVLRGEGNFPSRAVMPVPGTGVAVVWGTPYTPALTATPTCYSVIRHPESAADTLRFPEWLVKGEAHKHVPTQASTEILFGRWLVRLYTSAERAEAARNRGTVLWCTRLRDPDDKEWWGQFVDGANFARYIKAQTDDRALADGSNPTRPSKLMLADVPLIVAGTEGMAGPSGPGKKPPPAAGHLRIVGCPPFGFWSPRMPGNVWYKAPPVVFRVKAFCLRPMWVGDFLPEAGLLGPLFVPLSQQVKAQLHSADWIARGRAAAGSDNDALSNLPSSEAYDRVKARVVQRVMRQDVDAIKADDTSRLFASTVQGLTKGQALQPMDEQEFESTLDEGDRSDQSHTPGDGEGWEAQGDNASQGGELEAAGDVGKEDQPEEQRVEQSSVPAAVSQPAVEAGDAWSSVSTREPVMRIVGGHSEEVYNTVAWSGRDFNSTQDARQQRAFAARAVPNYRNLKKGEGHPVSQREEKRLEKRKKNSALINVSRRSAPAEQKFAMGRGPRPPRPWSSEPVED